jgi:hypothetical protein
MKEVLPVTSHLQVELPLMMGRVPLGLVLGLRLVLVLVWGLLQPGLV